jgi:arginase
LDKATYFCNYNIITLGQYPLRNIAIIEAPSILGLRDTGVDRLPEALLSCGLADRLSARLAAKLEPMPYDKHRDPASGLLNTKAIARFSVKLANAVCNVLDNGEFPLVLGGDCSILLGNLLALLRRGRFGLFFADGHADFYQPEANINGEVASSELALATGYGPVLFEGFKRLVRAEDVVVFGFRDEAEQRKYGSQPLPPSIMALNLALIRDLGVSKAVHQALNCLCREELDGFWLHLDADVLSDTIMPAVDYHLADGFSWNELVTMLKMVHASGNVVGLDVTIYNPMLDPGYGIASKFVEALTSGLK